MNKYQLQIVEDYFTNLDGKYSASAEDVLDLLYKVMGDACKYGVSARRVLLFELEDCLDINQLKDEAQLFINAFESDEDVADFLSELTNDIAIADQSATEYYNSMMYDYARCI